MLSESCKDIGEKAGIQMPETEGMQVSDPTSIRHLVTPGFCVSSIASSLRWVIFCLVMYYHGVPLSVLGSCHHPETDVRSGVSIVAHCVWMDTG
jgi:hypothetical protein